MLRANRLQCGYTGTETKLGMLLKSRAVINCSASCPDLAFAVFSKLKLCQEHISCSFIAPGKTANNFFSLLSLLPNELDVLEHFACAVQQ